MTTVFLRRCVLLRVMYIILLIVFIVISICLTGCINNTKPSRVTHTPTPIYSTLPPKVEIVSHLSTENATCIKQIGESYNALIQAFNEADQRQLENLIADDFYEFSDLTVSGGGENPKNTTVLHNAQKVADYFRMRGLQHQKIHPYTLYVQTNGPLMFFRSFVNITADDLADSNGKATRFVQGIVYCQNNNAKFKYIGMGFDFGIYKMAPEQSCYVAEMDFDPKRLFVCELGQK